MLLKKTAGAVLWHEEDLREMSVSSVASSSRERMKHLSGI